MLFGSRPFFRPGPEQIGEMASRANYATLVRAILSGQGALEPRVGNAEISALAALDAIRAEIAPVLLISEIRTMGADGVETVQTADVLGTGKVVLFAVPGAFTPGCSKIHLPGYVQGADDLKAKVPLPDVIT